MALQELPKIRTVSHEVRVGTTDPVRAFEINRDRWAWHIENVTGGILYYAQGKNGKNIAASGENQGTQIADSGADGFDEFEAIDEVWVLAASAGSIIVKETYFPGWIERTQLPRRI